MAYFLLVLVPAGLILPLVFAGRAVGVLARAGGSRRAGSGAWLRTAGFAQAAIAVGVYAWGLLHVTGAVVAAEDGGTNSVPITPCRTQGWETRGEGITGYRVEYVPLRFVCETDDVGDYATSVPGYVNPVFFFLGLGAAVCFTVVALDSGSGREPAGTGT
ncbi:hypothetical protein DEJ51_02200 [Streptomyces venezuelae]|uniref:Uncharacterized protein n=1 Tax=Streptomyces venezuelae TaxID=54571 RepID=A0A5P2DF52_STRVZ|nr:hypothetical protein [Streptomyces venezuelae]QES53210.1 hypothetical protein DEJ51_02200 [Streptomyces venezuelae]